MILGLNAVKNNSFIPSQNVQRGSGAHRGYYSIRTGGQCSRLKPTEYEADHSPFSNARLRMSGPILPLFLFSFMDSIGTTLALKYIFTSLIKLRI